ncbi:WhiB family transcriptional regulator [Streptomyces sp. NPDC001795]|uniref:WhiB family transcriptional regulator n=1 Tax=Streptomyces sp. NPDC001795 TaxID=3154525 RepID=UPI0033307B5A
MRRKPDAGLRPVEALWDWQQRAACRGLGSYFYSPQGERGRSRRAREQRALAICARCPVLEACGAFALGAHEPYGVWGGMTESQRRQILESDGTGTGLNATG